MQSMLDIFEQCQKIFISGSVGVGKTTFITNLVNRIKKSNSTHNLSNVMESNYRICLDDSYYNKDINIHIIPEYIDGDPQGNNMLQKYLTHEINAYEFQSYILNFYDEYMTGILPNVKKDDIIVFERLPDESVAIFANTGRRNGTINKEDHLKLYYRAIELDTKFGLPCIFNVNLNPSMFTCIRTLYDCDFTQSVMIMQQESQKQNLIVGLYNSVDVCYKRVVKRSRDSEASYTYKDIEVFVNMYLNMYNLILCNTSITFNMLDEL